ncbi:HTH-type transcriptional regulator ImmR [compost metagenome]
MPNNQLREIIGNRVREARTYLGLSQEEIGRALGIPRTAVSQIETGQRGLDATELNKLSSLLGRSTDYLTGGADATRSESVSILARAAEGLSDEDISELQQFAVFLKSRADGT